MLFARKGFEWSNGIYSPLLLETVEEDYFTEKRLPDLFFLLEDDSTEALSSGPLLEVTTNRHSLKG